MTGTLINEVTEKGEKERPKCAVARGFIPFYPSAITVAITAVHCESSGPLQSLLAPIPGAEKSLNAEIVIAVSP